MITDVDDFEFKKAEEKWNSSKSYNPQCKEGFKIEDHYFICQKRKYRLHVRHEANLTLDTDDKYVRGNFQWWSKASDT